MGLSIQRLADNRSDIDVINMWRRGDDLDAAISEADVVIDFSLPGATGDVATRAVARQKPLVCGVSGLGEEETEVRPVEEIARPRSSLTSLEELGRD